jgi:hypothetical protein
LTYPGAHSLYETRDDQPWSGDLRLLFEAGGDGALHLSGNLLQGSRAKPPLAPAFRTPAPLDVERSSLLTWEQHDSANSRAELLVDDLYLQYRTRRLDVAVGRQPVNLATTFYFVPNDFFAPFAPQTFFRNYKPGVDGLRADFRLAELSQLTLLGVLAYDRDGAAANGWSRGPDWSATALLLRVSRESAGFQWVLLAGTVEDRTVAGGSLQGELFRGVGLRAEGHYGVPETTDGAAGSVKLAVGLEKLYANNFSWRLEYFRNGGGPAAVDPLAPTAWRNRDYGALGLGYEFTPLLTGSFLLLTALNDASRLWSANLLYSLSNESEVSLLGALPSGARPGPTDAGSEFGRQPRLVLLEYRYYF